MSLAVGTSLRIAGRLHPTDLALAAGTVTALVGPNGSGKTSLLHALAAIAPAEGRVAIDDRDLRAIPVASRSRSLGFLPANREIAWPLAARDLVALGGCGADEVAAMLARLDLTVLAERRVDRLSTGERSRVLLARVLAPSPTLLLLDEPTANLDPRWQLRLMALVRAEVAGAAAGVDVEGSGRAALVAMHDLDAAARFADRLIVMDGGRIVADGMPAQVLASAVVPRVFGIQRRGSDWELVPPPNRSG